MSPKQVTSKLCQEIVHKKSGSCKAEVVEFSVQERKSTTFKSEYILNVLVKNCVEKQYQFLLKTPSTQRQPLFQTECSVYNVLPPDQHVCPSSFHCSDDVLVVDELLNSNYAYCKKVHFDDAHIKLVLEKIAEFHSLIKESHTFQSNANLEQLKSLQEEFLEEAKKIKLKTLEISDFEKRMKNLCEQMLDSLKPSKEFVNVVNHGDLRRENLLFFYENDVPVDCRLTNCYFANYSPPANDVLFFLSSVSIEKQTRKYFTEYLQYYFCCLKKHCVNSLQWDEFYVSCKILLPTSKLRSGYLSLEQRNNIIAKLEDIFTNNIISEEDCFAILNSRLGRTEYTLQHYSVKSFSERAGFLGDHFTLKINVSFTDGEQQLSFFVKTVPTTPSQREFSMANGAVFKENRMFTNFLPLLSQYGINVSAAVTAITYFCRLNDVIVQEDLKKQGFVNLDRNVSLGFEEVKMLLKTLAKFHSAFMILEEKVSKERGYPFKLNEEYPKEFKEVFYTKELPIIAEAMEACKTGARASVDTFYREKEAIDKESVYKLLETAIDKQEENVKPSNLFKNTITHGDLWVNNVLFKYKGNSVEDCKIIDFQSYRYHPPAHDVLCMIYLTTDRDFRKKYFTEALDVYFEELTKAFSEYGLQNVISKREFEESCKFYKESVLTQTLTHFQVILIPDDISKSLFANPDELKKVFFKDKYTFLKNTFAKYPNFKKRNEECFLDLLEHFESHCVN